MGHATYLVIDLASIAVPLIASFHPKLRFHRMWFAFWPACIATTLLFVGWDILYTHWGIWSFAERYTLGIYIANLPIEEVLFFVCIPYASIFSYHCLKLFGLARMSDRIARGFAIGLSIALLGIAIAFPDRLYTSVSFALCSLLLFLVARSKAAWLSIFLSAYACILLPFFIVNGLLTGTLLDEPVVRYDNAHNLGIRLLTIPVEDVFYGMLLLLLTTTLYEYLAARRLRLHSAQRSQQT